MRLNDDRLQCFRDLLYAIRSVKLLVYEKVFGEIINRVRNEQLNALASWLRLTFCFFTSFNQVIPGMAAGATFLTYHFSGNRLSADVVFPTLAYLNMLHQPISKTSLAISRQFSIKPSWTRVSSLIQACSVSSRGDKVDPSDLEGLAVRFQKSSFGYPMKQAEDESSGGLLLEIGDLNIPQGQLTLIIGPTGSGKSSLLLAMLKELTARHGSMTIASKAAYASQDPWIMSGSLRDNILFTKQMVPKAYAHAIKASALDRDLSTVPRGDRAETGDAGSNLSGGQKARLALARALYSDADILLLDDPMAAVDKAVASHIFESIVAEKRTVVMSELTHMHSK